MQSIAKLSEFGRQLQNLIQATLTGETVWTENLFGELASTLFELQRELNEPYRALCFAAGKSNNLNPQDWREIPAVPTSAFKDLELSCLPTMDRTTVFHSSGTTKRHPSRHFHSAESLLVYEKSLLAWFSRQIQIEQRLPIIPLTPPLELAPHSSLVHMFDKLGRKFGNDRSAFVGNIGDDGGWSLNVEAAVETLGRSAEIQQPILLLGTAFLYVHFLDYLKERNISLKLPVGTMVMETGGYKGRSRHVPKRELHQLIGERLGISEANIICEYGMSELSSQAYYQATAHVFHFPPWAQVQIISPETGREVTEGETGLIRVFDLANVFSVMAVQTEDLGIRRGAGFDLIGRASLAEARGCSLMTV